MGCSWATFLPLPCCFQALIIANNTERECLCPRVYNRINVHDTEPGLRLVIDWRVLLELQCRLRTVQTYNTNFLDTVSLLPILSVSFQYVRQGAFHMFFFFTIAIV